MPTRLDPEGRRELVRLMLEEGLPPRTAAARLGVSESTARRWRSRADEIRDTPLAIAERSIRDAEALMASVVAPVPRRSPREVPTPPRARVPLPRRVVPARVRFLRWTRRQASGVGLMLAAVPVGLFLSAALYGGGAGPVRDAADGRAPNQGAPVRFDPALATAVPDPRTTTVAAHVRGDSVVLRRRPGGRRTRRLRQRRIEGQRVPLVLLVKRRRQRWLQVHLPERPNGSTAWIHARAVRLRVNSFRVTVSLRRHRLTLWRDGRRVMTRNVGVGQALAPTPTGRYFVTDLIKARDPDGLYGPYAFGLSAYSPVHTTFRGGNGQIGIHGTNLPQALGTDVSQGCIRVSNTTIRRLARMLPLGTPVDIRA